MIGLKKFGESSLKSKEIFGIYGVGGFGTEILPLAREQLRAFGVSNDNLFFVDDKIKDGEHEIVNNQKLISFNEFKRISADKHNMVIAISDGKIREKLTEKCITNGVDIFNIQASNVIKLDNVNIGKGYILSPFVTLTSNINIGESFHANIYSYIAHDCNIGNYVTFAPSVKCNGNVEIGSNVYIGTGVIIEQGKPDKPLKIGNNVSISAGTIISKDIPDNVTVMFKRSKLMYIN